MTEQEAKEIEVAIEHIKARNMSAKHLDMAIATLEKQIPKKPLRIPTDDSCLYYELRCPCCDAYMSGLIEMHHCKCGQALDWT